MPRHFIESDFWDDVYIENVSREVILTYLYLLTSARCGVSGFIEVTATTISKKTKQTVRAVNNALSKLENDGKIVREGTTMLLLNVLKRNWNPSPKVLVKLREELRQIWNSNGNGAGLIPAFLEKNQHLPIQYPYSIDTVHHFTSPTKIPTLLIIKNESRKKTGGAGGKEKPKGDHVFSQSVVSEWEAFRAALSDWPEAKARYYYELFVEREGLHPTKYKYSRWDLAARAWDRRFPEQWKPQAASPQPLGTLDDLLEKVRKEKK